MIALLRWVFAAILVSIVTATVVASLDRGVLVALKELWPDAWFRATLVDAYAGFLTIYVWIAYRERSALRRVVWLLLVLGLGNIAIAAYVLRALRKLRPGDSLQQLLLRPDAEEA